MQTIFAKQIPSTERVWYVIDGKNLTLGRLATKVADILRGKSKRDFSPHVDNGDYVIVVNIDQIQVTGKKQEDKLYYRHSGFLGGLKTTKFSDLEIKHPSKAFRLAVSGMLPKNKLRDGMADRLKLVAGETHEYEAQKPIKIEL